MNIHEYQGKEVLRQFGIATPRGFVCRSPEEAVEAAAQLGGRRWMVKAQIHAGGRGAAGGVRLARSRDEVRRHAGELLGACLKTPRTGPEGRRVTRLLVEEGAYVGREFYLGLTLDRDAQRVALIASGEGGVDIEAVAAHTPDRIHKVLIDPLTGLKAAEADGLARSIGMPGKLIPEARRLMQTLYRAFDSCDASLAEINPLALTEDGRVIALDACFEFDANALFRHPEIAAMRDPDEEDPAALEASRLGLSYVPLEGNIGCLASGAGLAMATADAVRLYGGAPAHLVDVGSSATVEKVVQAFRLMLRRPGLAALLVHLFGGAQRCDLIAQGLIAAARELGLRLPLVVRLKGSHEKQGRALLAHSGLPIACAADMADAAELAVAAARGR